MTNNKTSSLNSRDSSNTLSSTCSSSYRNEAAAAAALQAAYNPLSVYVSWEVTAVS